MQTINERFKEIRKKYGLSQEELGNKIGLSKSGISNIEKGTRKVTDKHIKLLCSVFPINEEWLRNGIEPQTISTPTSIMEQLKREFGFDDFCYNLVYEYLKLDPKQRDVVRDFFYNVIKEKPENQKEDTTERQESNNDFQEACTVEEAEAEYIKSRSKPAKKMGQSASNITADTINSKSTIDKAVNQ